MKCIVGNTRGAVEWYLHQRGWHFLPFDTFADVHPKRLVEKVSQLAKTTMVATMNPYIVDCFDFADVVVVCGKKVATLDQHPDFERMRKHDWAMTPGEFWAWAGEEWVNEVGS